MAEQPNGAGIEAISFTVQARKAEILATSGLQPDGSMQFGAEKTARPRVGIDMAPSASAQEPRTVFDAVLAAKIQRDAVAARAGRIRRNGR